MKHRCDFKSIQIDAFSRERVLNDDIEEFIDFDECFIKICEGDPEGYRILLQNISRAPILSDEIVEIVYQQCFQVENTLLAGWALRFLSIVVKIYPNMEKKFIDSSEICIFLDLKANSAGIQILKSLFAVSDLVTDKLIEIGLLSKILGELKGNSYSDSDATQLLLFLGTIVEQNKLPDHFLGQILDIVVPFVNTSCSSSVIKAAAVCLACIVNKDKKGIFHVSDRPFKLLLSRFDKTDDDESLGINKFLANLYLSGRRRDEIAIWWRDRWELFDSVVKEVIINVFNVILPESTEEISHLLDICFLDVLVGELKGGATRTKILLCEFFVDILGLTEVFPNLQDFYADSALLEHVVMTLANTRPAISSSCLEIIMSFVQRRLRECGDDVLEHPVVACLFSDEITAFLYGLLEDEEYQDKAMEEFSISLCYIIDHPPGEDLMYTEE